MDSITQFETETTNPKASPWHICGWICAIVIGLSVLSCLVLSAIQSVAFTEITITALDREAEPKDHQLPYVKQLDALPDYDLRLILRRGDSIQLGCKPNSSAADGLTWHLYTPVGVARVSTIRLEEQDKVISDTLAEVDSNGNSVTHNGYRFDFTTERSFLTGVESFFELPIGKAIATGFMIAVLILALRIYIALH